MKNKKKAIKIVVFTIFLILLVIFILQLINNAKVRFSPDVISSKGIYEIEKTSTESVYILTKAIPEILKIELSDNGINDYELVVINLGEDFKQLLIYNKKNCGITRGYYEKCSKEITTIELKIEEIMITPSYELLKNNLQVGTHTATTQEENIFIGIKEGMIIDGPLGIQEQIFNQVINGIEPTNEYKGPVGEVNAKTRVTEKTISLGRTTTNGIIIDYTAIDYAELAKNLKNEGLTNEEVGDITSYLKSGAGVNSESTPVTGAVVGVIKTSEIIGIIIIIVIIILIIVLMKVKRSKRGMGK